MTSLNFMIERKRLTKMTGGLSDCRILFVQAPAGYGKTVFAGQWLDSRKEPYAMVTFDEYDNTAADVCFRLKNALHDLSIGEKVETVSAYTEHHDFNKAPAEFLMRAAAAAPRDIRASLVLDDLHYLTDMNGQKIVRDFIMRLPPGVKICILSRSGLPECFSSLLLKHDIQFIPREELLFDSREIAALYNEKNITLTKKEAESILSVTEGWPLGINALLLSKNQIPLESLSGDWLESFLKTQVWETWEEGYKEFMIAACIEDILTEGLCNALTGKSDSGRILEELAAKGAFLTKQRGGTYRFHNLFLQYLRKMFAEKPEVYRTERIRASGRWYLEQNDFYHAVVRFFYIKDYDQMACCFDLLEEIERAGFNMDQVMEAVRDTLDEEMLKRYPYLYFMMAFTARNEGRLEDFKNYADQYYSHYPQIVKRNPELGHNIFFLYMMDFRLSFQDILQIAVNTQASASFQAVRGTATLYFPFYHRSYKDFSELLPGDIEEKVGLLVKALGPLLGNECAMLKNCVQGGLYYEKGELRRAQESVLLAAGEFKEGFAPESKFCVMVLLLTVTHAIGQPGEEKIIQRDIQKMIETDKAYYLQFNFDAVLSRNCLENGDREAAQNWIETRGTDICEELDFLRLYGHFTTARAHIVLENYNLSILLLEKILKMCKTLKRPVDVIEAYILLAVSYWKKKRGNRKKALLYLEEAIRCAQKYGYKQAFINDGAELKNMLTSLKNWTMRSDYKGDLSDTFVKKLYIEVMDRAGYTNSRNGNRREQQVMLTRQQKKVALLMCEGYSYRKIAEELGIKFSTVRSHIELIYRKLDVSDMNEAVLKIRRLHLLDE